MIKYNPYKNCRITLKKNKGRDLSKHLSFNCTKKAELTFQTLTELIMIVAVSMVLIIYGGAVVKDTEYYQLYFAKDISLLLSSIASVNSVDSVSVTYHPIPKSRFSEFSYLIDPFYTTVTYINSGGYFSYLYQKKGYDMDYIHTGFNRSSSLSSSLSSSYKLAYSNPSTLYFMTDLSSVSKPLLISDSELLSPANSIFCSDATLKNSNSAFFGNSFSSIVIDVDSLVRGMPALEQQQIITSISALKASNSAYSSVTLIMPGSLQNTYQTLISSSSLIISFAQPISTQNPQKSSTTNHAISSRQAVTLRSSSRFSDYSCELMQEIDLKNNNAHLSYVPLLSVSLEMPSQQSVSASSPSSPPSSPISSLNKVPYSIILSSDSMSTSIFACFEIINYIVTHSSVSPVSSPSLLVSPPLSPIQATSSAGIPVHKDSIRGTSP